MTSAFKQSLTIARRYADGGPITDTEVEASEQKAQQEHERVLDREYTPDELMYSRGVVLDEPDEMTSDVIDPQSYMIMKDYAPWWSGKKGLSFKTGGAIRPDKMKKVDGPLGGNKGGVFKDKNGKTYYVKRAKSLDVANNEVLASELYKAIGVPVADKHVTMWQGSPAIAGKMIDGKRLKDFKKSQYRTIKELQRNFPADVWLGNYDAVGLDKDNILVDKKGIAHRIDVGGSLTRRAKGGKKSWWGPKVIEFGAMLNPKVNRFSNDVFNIKSKEIENDRREVAQRIADFPDEKIYKIVNQYGPGKAAEKKKLTDTLIARREQVADYYGIKKKYQEGGAVTDDATPDDDPWADVPRSPEGRPQITVSKAPVEDAPQPEPESAQPPQEPPPQEVRQRPGFVERSLQDLRRGVTQLPEYASQAVRDWWERGSEAAREGEQLTSQGFQDIASDQPATGLGKIGMGYLETLSSPITGLQRPIEKTTGDPEFAERAMMLGPGAAAKTMGIAVAGAVPRIMAAPQRLMQINRTHNTNQILDVLLGHNTAPTSTPTSVATPRQMGRITDILDGRNPYDIARFIEINNASEAIAPWLSSNQLARVFDRLDRIRRDQRNAELAQQQSVGGDETTQLLRQLAARTSVPQSASRVDPRDLDEALIEAREARDRPGYKPEDFIGKSPGEIAAGLMTDTGGDAGAIARHLVDMAKRGDPNFTESVFRELPKELATKVDAHLNQMESAAGRPLVAPPAADLSPPPPEPLDYRAFRQQTMEGPGLRPELITPLTQWTQTYRSYLPRRAITPDAASFIGRVILPHYEGNYKKFLDKFFQGLYDPHDFSGSIVGGIDNVSFRGVLRGQVHYNRKITVDANGNGYAYHGLLELPDTAQGRGLNKRLAAEQVKLYQNLGLDAVKLTANLRVGGHAWARYGYLPVTTRDWRHLADTLSYEADRFYRSMQMPERDYNNIKEILRRPDRHAIWDLSDYQTKIPIGVAGSTQERQLKWGQRLLLGTGWSGILHLKDEDVMRRFWRYVGR